MHLRSYENKDLILKAKTVGCYYCLNIYPATDVVDYVKDTGGQTAECPRCGIDSVVPYNPKEDKSIKKFKVRLEDQKRRSFSS